MAAADSTCTNNALRFTAAGDLYQLSQSATQTAVLDQLTARSDQLSALLWTITGDDGLRHFRSQGETVQAGYLWTVSMLADEVRDLARTIATTPAAACTIPGEAKP